MLQLLKVDYAINVLETKLLSQKTGSSVVVANHPFGGIEGVRWLMLLTSVRPDVKVLTNEILCRIPELQDIFIGVDILSKSAKERIKAAIDEARQWVADGHQLLIFPSGEVSSFDFQLKQIIDPKWRNTASSIALQANASVTPVFIEVPLAGCFSAWGFFIPSKNSKAYTGIIE